MSAWPFEDPKSFAAITLKRIMFDGRPIVYVSHDQDDGVWQFLDGAPIEVDDAILVSLDTIAKHDPSIMRIADLPRGWYAWRSTPSDAWQKVLKE